MSPRLRVIDIHDSLILMIVAKKEVGEQEDLIHARDNNTVFIY